MDYSLIIKLTNNCNLNCSYCYHRRDSNRNMGLSLTRSQLETLIRGLLENNEHCAEFIWHGGEPLLAGLDTFGFIVEKQNEYNTKGLAIRNSVQTNGTLLNEEYIQFFNENGFSIGISIDGPFDMHAAERGTFPSEYETILHSLDSLSGMNARYGTLCVVGKHHIGQARRIFRMIDEHRISNIGFLPCVVHHQGMIDPDMTISPDEYAQFLIDFFEIWIHSQTKGLSIRNFDDCIRFYTNKPSKTCISCNICDHYLTIAPDGGIYLCDNFDLSADHLVGHIDDGFWAVDEALPMRQLKEAMARYPKGCEECRYFRGCFGGCKYYRWLADCSMECKQYYCKAQQRVYAHVGQYFRQEEAK